MTIIILLLALAAIPLALVGGLAAPSGVIVAVAVVIGWAIVHRARKRRGSNAL